MNRSDKNQESAGVARPQMKFVNSWNLLVFTNGLLRTSSRIIKPLQDGMPTQNQRKKAVKADVKN
jgi:hypothetical protein